MSVNLLPSVWTPNQSPSSVTWGILDVEMEGGRQLWKLTAERYLSSRSGFFINNITEKKTRVWLAENEYIFHVTRVQSYNTSANYE